MTLGAPPLGRFVLRTLCWLAPCFALWYVVASALAPVTGALAWGLLDLLQPRLVSALETTGHELAFVTSLRAPATMGRTGVLVIEVNPLLYSYGTALFLALMLGARAQWWKLLAGAVVLLPFHVWGVAFDLLAQALRLGPDIATQIHAQGWRAEGVAIGYQLGSLLFPTLVPVLLWVGFCRAFVSRLGQRTGTGDAPGVPAPGRQ
jgi:hypothetical protein